MDADHRLAGTRTSYDTVAVSYADQLRGVLAGAPYLRAALALFADLVRAAAVDRWRMWTADPGTSPPTAHRRRPEHVAARLPDERPRRRPLRTPSALPLACHSEVGPHRVT